MSAASLAAWRQKRMMPDMAALVVATTSDLDSVLNNEARSALLPNRRGCTPAHVRKSQWVYDRQQMASGIWALLVAVLHVWDTSVLAKQRQTCYGVVVKE